MTKVIVRAIELNNENKYVLQIGASLCYKFGQLCLLQIRANVNTPWGSHYKLGQPLLQNRATITNWGIRHINKEDY